MPEDNPVHPSPVSSRFKRHLNKKVVMVTAAVAAGLLLAGLLYLRTQNDDTADSKKPYAFTYTKLDSFTLPGQSPGNGAIFSKPWQFDLHKTMALSLNQADFSHKITKNNQTITLGRQAVATVYSQTPLNASFAKNFDKGITDPKNPNRETYQAPLKQFAADRLDSRLAISLGQPKRLTTPYLKSNAWVVDFTTVDANTKDPLSPKNLKGQIVVAFGKNTYYYFMLAAIDYNWDASSKIWPQILDSLKIDT